jgi:hypothetical protein
MSDDGREWQANGNWFSMIGSDATDSLGTIILGLISMLLLVALLRTLKRERALIAAQTD